MRVSFAIGLFLFAAPSLAFACPRYEVKYGSEMIIEDSITPVMDGCDFSGKELNIFNHTSLKHANFSGATINGTVIGSDLTGANFSGAKITAVFQDSNLTGANFQDAHLALLV